LGKLGIEGWQMKSSDLLVKFFRKFVNFTRFVFVGVLVGPEINLGKGLVRE